METVPRQFTEHSVTAKAKRLWLQISLRTLILLVLAVGVGMGWLGHEFQQMRAQREASTRISELGGMCLRTAKSRGLLRTAAACLGRLFGQNLTGQVVHWVIWNDNATDAGLVHLKGLTQLHSLDLRGSKVTDAGLVHLKGLTELENLDLGSTRVTDAGLEYLKGFTELRHLDLWDTAVTDAGTARLEKALPGLEIKRFPDQPGAGRLMAVPR